MFPSDEAVREYQKIAERVKDKIPGQGDLRRMLDLDPDDPFTLMLLATSEGVNTEEREHLLWRGLCASPSSAIFPFQLSSLIRTRDDALSRGLLTLAARKLLRSPRLQSAFQSMAEKEGKPASEAILSDPALLNKLLDELEGPEPERVGAVLQPHRRVQDLIESEDGMDRELVDEILDDPVTFRPFLEGIIRDLAWPTPLGDMDGHTAAYAVALLGEIGDASLLKDLLQCADDNNVFDAAMWAMRRIAARQPQHAVAAWRTLLPSLNEDDQCLMVDQLLVMPPTPAAGEVLRSLFDDLGKLEPEVLAIRVIAVSSGLLRHVGNRVKPWLAERYQRFRSRLSPEDREVWEAIVSGKFNPGEVLTPSIPSEFNIHDICCENALEDYDGGEQLQEEAFVPKPVVRTQRPGRNEPCWCDSGKKYKKCHLEADEKEPEAGLRKREGSSLSGPADR